VISGILPFQILTDLGWFVFGVWALIPSSAIAVWRLDVCIVKAWVILKSFAPSFGPVKSPWPNKVVSGRDLGKKLSIPKKKEQPLHIKTPPNQVWVKKKRNPLRLLWKLLAL
jgi:hypothetical protein